MTLELDPIAPVTPSRPLRTAGLVALGLVAGIGGTLLLRPARQAGPATATAPARKKQMYQCPMHPNVMQDHAGDCPICGMKLVPIEDDSASASPSGDKGKIVFYRSPMNPSQTSPTPMKDEMGMDYVPVYESDLKGEGAAVEGHAAVTIDHERQQLIGLKVAHAEVGSVGGELRTTARLAVDETRVRKVNVKVEGFVEKLYVDFIGKPVAKGQPLFSLYSPEFVSAQKEFLLALKTQKALDGGVLQGSGSDLLDASRRRLMLWDVPKEAIEHLEKTGEIQRALPLRSPISGVVTAKNVVEGARITSADIPFEITDLSHVWALADVYEPEIPRVKVGQAATMTLRSFPGRTFQGRVAFVDPVLDPKTRTAKVRLEFSNPKGDLKPETFGEVVLKGASRKGVLVPMDAVMDAGTQKVVFLALGNGKFEPKEVTTGATVGEMVEVLSGLQAGDPVVTRANFLVDSESRLKAALAHMSRKGSPTEPAASGHQH